MAIDQAWVDQLWADQYLTERDDFMVEGVRIELPWAKSGGQYADRHWQRRIIEDIMPDSPQADAPVKILFRILRILLSGSASRIALEDVFDSKFEPLRAVFWREGEKKASVPVPFHVLPVKGSTGVQDDRVIGERAFLLLMRNQDGELNEPLVQTFLERFRKPAQKMDIAQGFLVETLHPNWNRKTEFVADLQSYLELVPPFMPDAAALFQRDVQHLLDAHLPIADHFQSVHMLLSLHFGLYMPRLAPRLNHSLKQLLIGLSTPSTLEIARIEALESGRAAETSFYGRLSLRAPSTGGKRPLRVNASPHTTYREMIRELNELHFSLLIFNRLRELTRSFLLAGDQNIDESSLFQKTRTPSKIAELAKTQSEYRTFLMRASEVLCVRFVKEQLEKNGWKNHRKIPSESSNGLDALTTFYRIYNLESATSASSSRAVKQGEAVVSSLLKSGDTGILRGAPGVGSYFELGANLIPLLLLTTIGSRGEKIQVAQFWEKLAEYGFSFEAQERELLLAHLKSMGLYERFSDAGEASYVRNLLVGV